MSNDFQRQAAAIVKQARDLKGLSQEKFGQLIGRTQSVVAKYELAVTPVPGEIVIQCMTILGLVDTPPSAEDVAALVREKLGDPANANLRSALARLITSID